MQATSRFRLRWILFSALVAACGDAEPSEETPVAPECGDGSVDDGETCDDGNTDDGDGCSAACQTETTVEGMCGDGTVDAGEDCDDGNTDDSDGCSAACAAESCGDGVVQSGLGEDCDDGNTADEDGCSSACATETCGDGVLQMGLGEECDDGNIDSFDGCSDLCVIEGCGDGVVQPAAGEVCDDGNTDDGDGCSSSCMSESCGDGVVQAQFGEVCDDGAGNGQPPSIACDPALLTAYGSHAYCHVLTLAGYGASQTACNDSGGYLSSVGDDAENLFLRDFTASFNSATPWVGASDFITEGTWIWSSGEPFVYENWAPGYPVIGSGEDCMRFAASDSAEWVHDFCGGNQYRSTCEYDLVAPCNATCSHQGFCGDGVVDPTLGEACDDLNTTAGDGCSATCQIEP